MDEPHSACTSCEKNMNCSSCLKTLGCGWCYDSSNPIQGICTGGDFSKPFIGMFYKNILISNNNFVFVLKIVLM